MTTVALSFIWRGSETGNITVKEPYVQGKVKTVAACSVMSFSYENIVGKNEKQFLNLINQYKN